jgi:ATP-binding cassette, subfamily C (CFTR/MRP), member 1
VDPNLLGIALVYALQLTGLLQWTVRVTIETETNMTAVERLLVFTTIPPEKDNPHIDLKATLQQNISDSTMAEAVVKAESVASSSTEGGSRSIWPNMGDIHIKNLQLRYRPGLGLVLKGVNLHISGGEKVGVIGRTGAGKSSLMLALFRIVEPEEGSAITIDGINILDMNLTQLRSNLTIIPQGRRTSAQILKTQTAASINKQMNIHSCLFVWTCMLVCARPCHVFWHAEGQS